MNKRVSIAIQRRDIELRYGALQRDAVIKRIERHACPLLLLPYLRVAELERIFADRFGTKRFPNTPQARNGIRAIAEHLVVQPSQNDPVQRVVGWIRARAPWVPREHAMDIAQRAARKRRMPSADMLAWSIGLDMATRARLGIKTIGAFDCDRKARIARRRAEHRDHQTKKRRAYGQKPRAEYLAQALTTKKPWEALGMSRSTWYRRGRPNSPFSV
jgi:hypothetical protein